MFINIVINIFVKYYIENHSLMYMVHILIISAPSLDPSVSETGMNSKNVAVFS
jgi:hypothetical protein